MQLKFYLLLLAATVLGTSMNVTRANAMGVEEDTEGETVVWAGGGSAPNSDWDPSSGRGVGCYGHGGGCHGHDRGCYGHGGGCHGCI
ncbi:unnamed protein product [Dibothriocephalus latus]|uniref:Uncharacterized protein n=1 Tax=Dibothriocephalus latus TaxID=60516 RepID=A0A3P7NK13_DIBLA|nr:unnamed protein product [Dibothriocephalus latus]